MRHISRNRGYAYPDMEEDRKGTWNDSGYRASDMEAHRNAVYSVKSVPHQIFIIFMNQMKLFSKARFVYIMLFFAISMPLLMVTLHEDLMSASLITSCFGDTSLPSTTMCIALSLMPIFMSLFTSILCGTELPNEYKFRTAYLNLPLPLSRFAFYFGKYLAGFVLCLATFIFVFGMGILTTSLYFDKQFTDLLLSAMLLTIVAVFAYTATAYCIGSFMKKGSSIVPFIIMYAVLPLITFLGYAKFESTEIFLLPCNLCDMALASLGAIMTPSLNGICTAYMDVGNITPALIVGVLWGIAFLVLGYFKDSRREL